MSEAMERCYFCKGRVEPRRIRHVYEWGERIYVFENVPAEVCTQCKESYFAPETVRRFDAIVEGAEKSRRKMQVPVYDL